MKEKVFEWSSAIKYILVKRMLRKFNPKSNNNFCETILVIIMKLKIKVLVINNIVFQTFFFKF